MKRYAPFIFFFILIAFFVIRELIIEGKLNNNVRYTIGVIDDISHPVDGGPMASYSYKVYHKKYSGIFSIDSDLPKVNVNDKFIVKFNIQSPNISYPQVEYRIVIPLEAPDSGWIERPSVLK